MPNEDITHIPKVTLTEEITCMGMWRAMVCCPAELPNQLNATKALKKINIYSINLTLMNRWPQLISWPDWVLLLSLYQELCFDPRVRYCIFCYLQWDREGEEHTWVRTWERNKSPCGSCFESYGYCFLCLRIERNFKDQIRAGGRELTSSDLWPNLLHIIWRVSPRATWIKSTNRTLSCLWYFRCGFESFHYTALQKSHLQYTAFMNKRNGLSSSSHVICYYLNSLEFSCNTVCNTDPRSDEQE